MRRALFLMICFSLSALASEDGVWKKQILDIKKVRELIEYAKQNRAGKFLDIRKVSKVLPDSYSVELLFINRLSKCSLYVVVSKDLSKVLGVRSTEFGDPKFECKLH